MATPHNNANIGEIEKIVIMPGDPLRAKFIAENYLDDYVMFSDVRNVYGYTGSYKGKRPSVMAHGMGMPSMGIYSYELYNYYGVDTIIRVGSAGSYKKELDIGNIIFAQGACTDSNILNIHGTYSAICDYNLLQTAVEVSNSLNIEYAIRFLVLLNAHV